MRIKKRRRVIVIPDIHGDLRSTIRILLQFKVINKRLEWTAKPPDTVVVQLGDQLDGACRVNCDDASADKSDDIRLLKLMTYLHIQANKHGGAVFSLLGNHEIMNASGDFRYVSKRDMMVTWDKQQLSRNDAFKAGKGLLARFLAETRLSYLIIGKDIFVHAGMPKLSKGIGLRQIAQYTRRWLMTGKRGALHEEMLDFFWNRRMFSHRDAICKQIPKGYRLFAGHTLTSEEGRIEDRCNKRLFFTDVGISLNVSGVAQIIVIDDGEVTVFRFQR